MLNRIAVVVTGVLLFVASVLAAKLCEDFENAMPNVDANGVLVDTADANGTCHSCLNTKNGKERVKCTGTVENESGVGQKYKDDEFFANETVQRSLYKVKSNGAAKLSVKGVVDLQG